MTNVFRHRTKSATNRFFRTQNSELSRILFNFVFIKSVNASDLSGCDNWWPNWSVISFSTYFQKYIFFQKRKRKKRLQQQLKFFKKKKEKKYRDHSAVHDYHWCLANGNITRIFFVRPELRIFGKQTHIKQMAESAKCHFWKKKR